jgi:AcrR family transcriptional regulator
MITAMTRWFPDAPKRLQQAAMQLFDKRGFDETTVAEIAAQAGLTERTFFRHFADKREVLFEGSSQLEEAIVAALAGAPAGAAPIEAVAIGLEAAGRFFTAERREYSRRRNAIITANAELRERELIKLASLGSAIAEALRARGIPRSAASLSAEAGLGVFRVAFERWVEKTNERDWADLVNESLAHLKELASGGKA